MQKVFSVKALVWVWPGDMPWHFISIDPVISKILRERFPKTAMIKVKVNLKTINNEKVEEYKNDTKKNSKNLKSLKIKDKEKINEWETSLFRNKKENIYMMPIKKEIRKKHGIHGGDVLDIEAAIL